MKTYKTYVVLNSVTNPLVCCFFVGFLVVVTVDDVVAVDVVVSEK